MAVIVNSGVVSSGVILIWDSMIVNNGGVANDTTISNGGGAVVSGGGVMNDVLVNSYGALVVQANGKALQITENGGYVEVANGGKAFYVANAFSGLVLDSGAKATLHSGTTANSTTIVNGWIGIYDRGLANSLTISKGTVDINAGGSADLVFVGSYCNLNINANAKATNIRENGGWVSVDIDKGGSATYAANSFSGLVLNGHSATLHSGTTANSTTMNGGFIHIYSCGVAHTLTVSGGNVVVEGGGSADNVFVNSYCKLYLDGAGATVTKITENGGYVGIADDASATFLSNSFSGLVLNGQAATLHSGTTANSTTLKAGWSSGGGYEQLCDGHLYVYSGGFASNTTVSGVYVQGIGWRYGRLHIYGEADTIFMVNSSYIYVNGGGKANSATMNDGHMYVYSGGAVNSAIVNGGRLYVSAGAAASAITENGGYVEVADGAEATFASNSFSGLVLNTLATLHSGTTANATVVNNYGELNVYSSGVANENTVNGTLHVYSSGVANENTVNYRGSMYVHSSAVANSNTVNSYGYLYVYSGGVANENTVNSAGYLSVENGGVAKEMTVSAGGRLSVAAGGKVTGSRFTIDYGANVSVNSAAIVDLDISTLDPGSSEVLNHYDLLGGAPLLNITVAADQENGVYSLARGVKSTFDNKTQFTVYTDEGAKAGTLIVGDSITIGSGKFALSLADETLKLTVSGSQYVGPEVLSITADPTGPTNQNVTVTATFTKRAVNQEYSFDKTNWKKYYSTGVVVENNDTTVYFRGATVGGKYSDIKSYKVTNIDRVPPEAPTASADIVEFTDEDVTVTAVYSDDTVTKQYSLDQKTWKEYPAEGVVMPGNGSVYFRGLDAAGNESPVTEYVVANIKSAKVLFVEADITEPTNKNVTVTATFSDETVTKEYSLDGETWFAYQTGVVMTDNGSVYFRAGDADGNFSKTKQYAVANIDRVPPEKPVALADITELTKENVTVTATFSGDSAVREYSLDNSAWQVYDAPVVMKENGSVYFRAQDAAGNISDVTEYDVTNIDRVPPEKPVVSADITTPTNQNVTVSATFGGDTVTKEYRIDGRNWLAYTGSVVMTGNGTVGFRGIDVAGNVSEIAEYDVTNIDRVPPEAPKASADIVKLTNKTVTVTATFSDDSVKKEYSLDGETWSAYTKGVSFTVNGTVFFRAADAAGNISAVTEYDVSNIADGSTSFAGDLGYNGVYERSFTPTLTESGWYTVSGDFGTFNGSLTIYDNGRKVASGKIKNGTLNFNRNRVTLLDKAEPYNVVVKTSDKNRRASDFSFSINAYELFDKADNSDDNWKTAPAMAPGETLDNWVGYGDVVDWRAMTTDRSNGGVYGLFLSDVRERVKVTVYAKQGDGLKKVKSFTASPGKRTASIPYLSVAPDTQYYFAVEAPGAKKAKNSDYKLEFTQRGVFNWADNNWADAVEIAETGGRTGALSTAADGDRVDYNDLSGVKKLTFTMTDGKAKISFYDENCQKVKLEHVRMADGSIRNNVSSLTLTNGSVVTDAVALSDLDGAVKYLKVEAASKTLCAYTIA